MEHVELNGVCVALIRRAASTTIKRTTEIVGIEPARDGIPAKCYAFIRDPLERFFSGAKYLPHNYVPAKKVYKDYVDAVLAGDSDIHWIPQSEVLKGVGELLLRPFENLNYHWTTELMPKGFPQLDAHNITPTISKERIIIDTRYRLDDLVEYYKDDYGLRDLAWQN